MLIKLTNTNVTLPSTQQKQKQQPFHEKLGSTLVEVRNSRGGLGNCW